MQNDRKHTTGGKRWLLLMANGVRASGVGRAAWGSGELGAGAGIAATPGKGASSPVAQPKTERPPDRRSGQQSRRWLGPPTAVTAAPGSEPLGNGEKTVNWLRLDTRRRSGRPRGGTLSHPFQSREDAAPGPPGACGGHAPQREPASQASSPSTGGPQPEAPGAAPRCHACVTRALAWPGTPVTWPHPGASQPPPRPGSASSPVAPRDGRGRQTEGQPRPEPGRMAGRGSAACGRDPRGPQTGSGAHVPLGG